MDADALYAFKKISIQKKLISKLEKEINDLNSILYSLKKEHASLIDEHFSTSDTLVEKIVNMDCITCTILKLENKNLKGQLAHVISYLLLVLCIEEKRGIGFDKKPRLSRRSSDVCYSQVHRIINYSIKMSNP